MNPDVTEPEPLNKKCNVSFKPILYNPRNKTKNIFFTAFKHSTTFDNTELSLPFLEPVVAFGNPANCSSDNLILASAIICFLLPTSVLSKYFFSSKTIKYTAAIVRRTTERVSILIDDLDIRLSTIG